MSHASMTMQSFEPADVAFPCDTDWTTTHGAAPSRVLTFDPRRLQRPPHEQALRIGSTGGGVRSTHAACDAILGESAALLRALDQIEKVAASGATVLVRGETGTGKELIARAVHAMSERRDRPFVKLNCAAIPTGLLESELFGHERGAFTGAVAQRVGRFELAHTGTLFLDEAGDIPPELQPKLLRVLQEQEFERLGSPRTQRVDVRLVAATNRHLEQMVADGTFRADLYYRLNVFPVALPPLRERREDLPLLVDHLVQRYATRLGKRIDTVPAEAMRTLTQYDWPGNVRELENTIERAVILSSGATLQLPPPERRPSANASPIEGGTLHDIERAAILSALRKTGWVVGGPRGAAALLGVKRTTLQGRMQKHGIAHARAAAVVGL